MNPALLLGLSVLAVVLVGGAAVVGSGSLGRGLRTIASELGGELVKFGILAIPVAVALVAAFFSGGDAWTFLVVFALIVGGIAGGVLLILCVRRVQRPSGEPPPRATVTRPHRRR